MADLAPGLWQHPAEIMCKVDSKPMCLPSNTQPAVFTLSHVPVLCTVRALVIHVFALAEGGSIGDCDAYGFLPVALSYSAI